MWISLRLQPQKKLFTGLKIASKFDTRIEETFHAFVTLDSSSAQAVLLFVPRHEHLEPKRKKHESPFLQSYSRIEICIFLASKMPEKINKSTHLLLNLSIVIICFTGLISEACELTSLKLLLGLLGGACGKHNVYFFLGVHINSFLYDRY